MRLEELRSRLCHELESLHARECYAYARSQETALQPFSTIPTVIGALDRRAHISHELREDLLRCLVRRAQENPFETLWQEILLYSFLPTLIGALRQTKTLTEHDEIGAFLWTIFLETLATYPLDDRTGSIAQGLAADTKKSYWNYLDQLHKERNEYKNFLMYAHMYSPREVSTEFVYADPRLNEDDRQDLRALLGRARIKPEDIELILATVVDGLTVPQYVARNNMAPTDARGKRREYVRLWQRKRRVKKRFEEFLKKRRRKCLVFP